MDEMLSLGRSNLRGSVEDNILMFVQANPQVATVGDAESIITVRIGIAKIPPSTWLKTPWPSMWKRGDKVELNLAEVGLSLTLEQAQQVADALRGFAVRNELSEEFVSFGIQGGNPPEDLSSKQKFPKPVSYVNRPNSASVPLPVEARIMRAETSRSKRALKMGLVARKKDEDGEWSAEVRLDSTEAQLLSYIIFSNVLYAKYSSLDFRNR
jgi:hypothetical protein